MGLRVVMIVLVFLLTATAMHAQDSVSTALPAPEALGVGWQISGEWTPSADERAEGLPWAAEYAYRRYGGPRGWRVVVVVARPKSGIAAAADAVKFVEGLVDNVYRNTSQSGEYRSPSVLADIPAPAGCEAVSRAEGLDEIFEMNTGATSCVTASDLVVYAVVSGGVGNATLPDPTDPAFAGTLTRTEAADAVVAAMISGRAVHGMAMATPLATPA